MKTDLRYAQASLDWAVTNLPTFEQGLNLWLKENIKTQLIHTDSNVTHDVIVAVEKEPFPLSFSVHAGLVINAMRSALDMVAWAVFKRDTLLHPKEVFFPIAESLEKWRSGDYKGSKFVAQLGGTERRILESLEPYRGGNDTLYWLHWLDISRKHKRLLNVSHVPAKLTIIGNFDKTEFEPLGIDEGFIAGSDGETILGLWSKTAAKPKLGYTPEILVEDSELSLRGPIMSLLSDFSRQTQAIIELFDY